MKLLHTPDEKIPWPIRKQAGRNRVRVKKKWPASDDFGLSFFFFFRAPVIQKPNIAKK